MKRINNYGLGKRKYAKKEEPIRIVTRVGDKELFLDARLAGVWEAAGKSEPDICDVIVKCTEMGIIQKGEKRLVISPGRYGKVSAYGPYDKDIILFTAADDIKRVGQVVFVYPDDWYIETISDGTFPIDKMKEYRHLGSTLAGEKMEDFENAAETNIESIQEVKEQYEKAKEELMRKNNITPVKKNPVKNEKVVIYSSSYAVNAQGPAGCGYVIAARGKSLREGSKGFDDTSKMAAELIAINNAIKIALRANPAVIEVFTRTSYIINVANDWGKMWQRNGWKKKDGSEVKNLPLLKELMSLVENNNIRMFHLYSGNDSFSKRCDVLAERAAMSQIYAE